MSDSMLAVLDFEGNTGGYLGGKCVIFDKNGMLIKNYQKVSTIDFELVIADGNVSIKLTGDKP